MEQLRRFWARRLEALGIELERGRRETAEPEPTADKDETDE
ncbi:hypothetical protein GCM10027269_37170 [Kribbella endophytica]